MSYRRVLMLVALVCIRMNIIGALFLSSDAHAEEAKRIYIAPDDHTDYFWTADENAYRQAFLEMIDYYLDLADETEQQGLPSDFQSRWNCDGSFWIWEYERNKPAADFERLMGRVQDGHISFPLNSLATCPGGAPAEAVLRGMYYAGKLQRRYDLAIPMAISMENQTLPYGLGMLWSGSGAKYSWKGICSCDSLVPDAWDREHEVYWMAGPDGSRVLMKWNSMLTTNQGMGGYAEAYNPPAVVDYVDGNPDFKARYPYRVIGAFGKGWDDLKTMTDWFVTTAGEKNNASRRVVVSNQQDFFADFESTYGGVIPSQASSFGNEWDLYCAALAEVSARVKRAVENLRSAEALATLVSLKDPGFMTGRESSRDLAWMDLGLFWEHNFGMVNPQTGSLGVQKRIAWQRRLAGEIENYANTLKADAASELGSMIAKSGDYPRFYAFNPLSWTRTDMADLPYSDTNPFHVIDLSTGLETPSQIVMENGGRFLRIMAEGVPAVGYKVFEVRPGSGAGFSNAASVSSNVMENERYRITVSQRGAITSLLDKAQGNWEIARQVNGRYINDLGGGSGGILSPENQGPVSVTMKATAATPIAHTTRITLIRASGRIEVKNEITQNFDDVRTWGFGFNLNNPDVWHEEVGAVIRARLTTQGGHYAASRARYDWLTMNHFADVSDGQGGRGVTVSNADCYFMKVGSSTTASLDVVTPQISVLAGGRVANGDNGLPGQGGDSYFLQRFALQGHDGYSPAEAMRFAIEHQNPLVTGLVTGGTGYPEMSFSLLTISDTEVLLWALKPADDGIGNGIIARLWNLAPAPVSFSLTVPSYGIQSAAQANHIETPLANASVINGVLAETMAARQLKTFALNVLACETETDNDCDGVYNQHDNCPADYNPDQEDNYPPGGNNCGDACECLADCNDDLKVSISDLVILKQEFPRIDCRINPCQADCNYDNKVSLADLVIMKNEFLRTDCPACP